MMISDLLQQANAFVAARLPGTEGQGAADVLSGDFDGSSTLPMTWPAAMSQILVNIGDAVHEPLIPLGHGLSYEP